MNLLPVARRFPVPVRSAAHEASTAIAHGDVAPDVLAANFLRDISRNPVNATILARWEALELPDAWLVAGCLFQTVWNLLAGRAPQAGIKDHDLFYFDPSDLSERGERQAQARVDAVLADLGVTVEVANQARVHQWYPRFFGRPCPELRSAQDGIGRFLVLETCVGVRPGACIAPHGLQGVYARTLSANPLTPWPELFDAKVASYQARWPELVVAGSPQPLRGKIGSPPDPCAGAHPAEA